MREKLAIHVQDVSKTYSLYGSQRDQFVDVLRLSRFGLRPRSAPTKFNALTNINLDIQRGQRLGIIGRNGAGKTTLLKLLCGNFKPTSGSIEVNGTVQALMSIGLGFHPEYTGRENVRASLHYNGLSRDEFASATDDIIEFCELGEFFDQPFKTYSLGMQARLMFAAATAISPDILIVDEVLGAGDAYFVAKSKVRMQSLVQSGCTMLLVSHSMQQVLEFCDSAVWIDKGEVVLEGPTLSVIKSYEKEVSTISHSFEEREHLKKGVDVTAVLENQTTSLSNTLPESVTTARGNERNQHELDEHKSAAHTALLVQDPALIPHRNNFQGFQVTRSHLGFSFIADGGLSRWSASEPDALSVVGFTVASKGGETNKLTMLEPAEFIFDVQSLKSARYSCRYGVAIINESGIVVSRLHSQRDEFQLNQGVLRRVRIMLNPVQLGSGDYTISLAVLEHNPLEILNSSRRYDLLSRSFQISVQTPLLLEQASSCFFHTSEWSFE